MTPEQAYYGLRYLQPEAIRMLRLAFDNGLTLENQTDCVKKSAAKFNWPDRLREMTLGAITWMAEHPDAGRIRRTEGDAYVFIEEDDNAPAGVRRGVSDAG